METYADEEPLYRGRHLWNKIQFPKRCVLLFFRIPDDGQSPKTR
jgi:hypothetical protein